ncbi:ABC-F type ribosomal protection protein [Acidaminobacter sp. JC074]|uniref:ribosomal protection-like ABC-F family protein n=1 Tax=Acidaminobacter sp. JC074 TaxID=2530199 RepID=UPI001F0EA656|nr:ABC-F type ribosomal protection protein [Acidaminobacter sp. JC074]MCH4891108.1 ABC-F type ribosomal protection protein [Acidaminobacter sp. JC074]
MIDLALKNVNKYFGATKVFDDISFELHSKSRVGLIGRNGTGKTTVFKIIAGIENYNDGQITYRKGATVGYLDQIPSYPNKSVLDVLHLAFNELEEMSKSLKSLEDKLSNPDMDDYDRVLKAYGSLQATYELKGGYETKERVDRICSGFKFKEDFLTQPFERLSGGEKTRVILAKILLESPSILLLDEPTNHLDLDSVEWLEDYLKDYEGSVLIISHDRYFLDAVVSEIYEIEGGTTSKFHGNYSYYVKEKERRILEQLEQYKQQQRKIKAMEEAIKRFRDWGTRADNEAMFVKAKQVEKRLDKMDKLDRPGNHKKIALSFNEEKRSGKEVIRIRDLSKGFDSKPLLEEVEMDVMYQDFVAFLGKNGSGKTTLLKMILGQEVPDKGSLKVSESAKIGYMEQEIHFDFPEKSVLQGFKDHYALTEEVARRKLARFLFYSDDVFKTIGNLSGGEKVRLSLCMMMEEKINFLILDEPTNHVDIDSREMIEQALKLFSGTVLFISHDRYFIDQLATKVIRIEDKKLITYHGNYQYFKDQVEKLNLEPLPLVKEKKVQVKEKSEKKGLNIFKQRELEELELAIEDVEEEIVSLENLMAEQGDYQELMKLQNQLNDENKKLEALMEKWMSYQ